MRFSANAGTCSCFTDSQSVRRESSRQLASAPHRRRSRHACRPVSPAYDQATCPMSPSGWWPDRYTVQRPGCSPRRKPADDRRDGLNGAKDHPSARGLCWPEPCREGIRRHGERQKKQRERIQGKLQPGLSQRQATARPTWHRTVVGLTNPCGCVGHGRLPRMLTNAPTLARRQVTPPKRRAG